MVWYANLNTGAGDEYVGLGRQSTCMAVENIGVGLPTQKQVQAKSSHGVVLLFVVIFGRSSVFL